MTLFMLFAGLGILIYTGLAYREATVSRFNPHAAFGVQFAYFAPLSILGPTLHGLFGSPVQYPGSLVSYAEINGLFAADLSAHTAQGR